MVLLHEWNYYSYSLTKAIFNVQKYHHQTLSYFFSPQFDVNYFDVLIYASYHFLKYYKRQLSLAILSQCLVSIK